MNFTRGLQRLCVTLNRNNMTVNLSKQTSACYSVKKQHRRPIRIYDAESEPEATDDVIPRRFAKTSSDNIKGVIELDKQFPPIRERSDDFEPSKEGFEEDDVKDSAVGTHYIRLGDTDSSFDHRMVKVQSKKMRHRSNLIMLEGKRIIQDAILAGVIPTEIFFTKNSLVENLTMPPGEIKLFKMPYNKMKKWSPLTTPPGIIAFCKKPKNLRKKPNNAIPLTVICDNVREPGNLGTILRTVAGVGCIKVLLTKGCVDLWDSKVIRSAAGAHFYVPIESDLTWDEVNEEIDENARVFIAHHIETEDETAERQSIPTIPYFSIDYSCLSSIVVIIGGETEGISDNAIIAARFRDGLKVNIPLSCNIDSLNVGAAISTILFEIKRQFIINNMDNDYCGNNEISGKQVNKSSTLN